MQVSARTAHNDDKQGISIHVAVPYQETRLFKEEHTHSHNLYIEGSKTQALRIYGFALFCVYLNEHHSTMAAVAVRC